MFTNKPTDSSNPLAEHVAATADSAIKSTQGLTNKAFDGLAQSVQDLKQHASPFLNRTAAQVNHLEEQGAEIAHARAQQLRAQAVHASDTALNYVKTEPVRSVLIAAATGAALMALLSLFSRAR